MSITGPGSWSPGVHVGGTRNGKTRGIMLFEIASIEIVVSQRWMEDFWWVSLMVRLGSWVHAIPVAEL